MQPYYDHNGIKIYHGDCREILPLLAAESADLLLTDPPYGQKWQSNYRQAKFDAIAGDETQDAAVAGVALALRCLKPMRHVYAFGRYDFSGLPLSRQVELIWDKVNANAGDLSIPWGSQHEYIQFAVYVPSAQARKDGRGNLTARLRRGSVLRHLRPNATAVKDHPTEKPVMLLRELIESSSVIGDAVLDPFMGVGSTLVAAAKEDRRAIGIEIEERYCEVAASRLSRSVLPLEMTA